MVFPVIPYISLSVTDITNEKRTQK